MAAQWSIVVLQQKALTKIQSLLPNTWQLKRACPSFRYGYPKLNFVGCDVISSTKQQTLNHFKLLSPCNERINPLVCEAFLTSILALAQCLSWVCL